VHHAFPEGGGAPAPGHVPAATAGSQRILGLDMWRAILMMLGLVRHAADWRSDDPVFNLIILVSASFRMGAFFCISGLLTGYALLRRPARSWIRRRMFQLGVPLLFGLLVLCPTLSLLNGWINVREGGRFSFGISWYHLWFLVALMLYSAGAVWLHRFDVQRGWIDGAVRRMGTVETIVMIAGAATFVTIIVTTLILSNYTPTAYWNSLAQIRWITGYALLFAFGFAISRSDVLHRQAIRQARLAYFIIAALVIADAYAFGYVPGVPEQPALKPLAFAAGAAFGPLAASLLILRSAFRIGRVPPALCMIADASFTIYLVHLPFLALAYTGLTFVAWNPYVESAVAIGASGVLSLALHELVVRRSPIMALLLNGRPLPRPAAGSAASSLRAMMRAVPLGADGAILPMRED
jgi:glucan biosynthesis protein C